MFSFGMTFTMADIFYRSRSESAREEHLDTEFDDVERDATVSLYSKVVEGLASTEGHSGGNGNAHHWALVVSFVDGSYRTLEGIPNDDNFLHAHYTKCRGDGMTELKKLGIVRTSPAKLRSIARQNSLNGSRYDLLDTNCQDWAIRAAKDISPSIGHAASSVPRIARMLCISRILFNSRENPAVALTGAMRLLNR